MTDAAIRGRVFRRVSEADLNNPGLEVIAGASKFGHLAVAPFSSGTLMGGYQGAYFVGCNATPGTAVATTTSITSFDATKPVALLFNTGSPTDQTAKDIVMDFVTMNIAQVPTSATSWQYAWTLDTIDRYSSAGTAITPKSSNGNVSTASICRMHFGAPVTVAAGASVRILGRGALRGIIPTTLDEMGFRFGSEAADTSALLTSGSAKYYSNCPPIVIAPGQSLLLNMWGASNAAAPSWEFTFGWYEI